MKPGNEMTEGTDRDGARGRLAERYRKLAEARKKSLGAAVATRFSEIDGGTQGVVVSVQLFTTVIPLIIIGFDFLKISVTRNSNIVTLQFKREPRGHLEHQHACRGHPTGHRSHIVNLKLETMCIKVRGRKRQRASPLQARIPDRSGHRTNLAGAGKGEQWKSAFRILVLPGCGHEQATWLPRQHRPGNHDGV